MQADVVKMMQANLTYFITQNFGKSNQVEIEDSQGQKFSAQVQAISQPENNILLKILEPGGQRFKFKMMQFKEINLMKFRYQDQKNRFKTDSQTIEGSIKKEKTLVKWDEQASGPETSLEEKVDKVNNFINDRSLKSQEQPFNQFEVIENRFGLKPTYDEYSYTTKLHYDKIDDNLKQFAEKQEAELLTNPQQEMNKHLLEERNLKPLEDENERHELDEEELYSAVMESGNYKNYQNKKQKKNKNKKKGQHQQGDKQTDNKKIKKNIEQQQQETVNVHKLVDSSNTKKFFNSKLCENNLDEAAILNESISIVNYISEKNILKQNENAKVDKEQVQLQQQQMQLPQQSTDPQIVPEEEIQQVNEIVDDEQEIDDIIEPIAPTKLTKFKLKDTVVGAKINYEKSFINALLEEYGNAIEIFKWQTMTKDWQSNKKERLQKPIKKPLQVVKQVQVVQQAQLIELNNERKHQFKKPLNNSKQGLNKQLLQDISPLEQNQLTQSQIESTQKQQQIQKNNNYYEDFSYQQPPTRMDYSGMPYLDNYQQQQYWGPQGGGGPIYPQNNYYFYNNEQQLYQQNQMSQINPNFNLNDLNQQQQF